MAVGGLMMVEIAVCWGEAVKIRRKGQRTAKQIMSNVKV